VRLFRRAAGYVGTELEPEPGEPGWYRTTDRWDSEDAYHAFRAAFADEYAALDAQCEALTAEERFVRASLHARLGDITTLDVDAIVNAANTSLARGGGVCGAIHRAAGPELARACAGVAPCPTGEARITPGFALPARFVIHAVGPVWEGGSRGEAELLASAYRASLGLARDHGLHSIAFPAISTGIYGYPLGAATAIAIGAVREFLHQEPGSVEEVVFVAFDARTEQAYRDAGLPVAT
jgi:O-acetyl-ADP-ribose deacetylase (regulator of RNase III)